MIAYSQHSHPKLAQPAWYSPAKSQPDTEPEEAQGLPAPTHSSRAGKDGPRRLDKVKSSLCKNYLVSGVCPYGERCQFAHGPRELRCNTVENTSYKTKPCFSFLNKVCCPYGHRCNFIHRAPVPPELSLLSQKVGNFPEMAGLMGPPAFARRLLAKLGLQQDK